MRVLLPGAGPHEFCQAHGADEFGWVQVLGDIQFKFYHQWFDFIFILSALFFLAVFWTIDCSRQPSSLATIKVPNFWCQLLPCVLRCGMSTST